MPRRCRLLLVLWVLALAPLALTQADEAARQSPVPPVRHEVLLPLVASVAPADLVVTRFALVPPKLSFRAGEPVEVRVTVANLGVGTAQPFWVDLYINPSGPPGLNRPWASLCRPPCQGIAWIVGEPLAPGAEVTLTSTPEQILPNYSVWRGTFAVGTTSLAVYADSYNPGDTVGASGDFNVGNNLAVISGLRVVP
jgi:hypothetical protein